MDTSHRGRPLAGYSIIISDVVARTLLLPEVLVVAARLLRDVKGILTSTYYGVRPWQETKTQINTFTGKINHLGGTVQLNRSFD